MALLHGSNIEGVAIHCFLSSLLVASCLACVFCRADQIWVLQPFLDKLPNKQTCTRAIKDILNSKSFIMIVILIANFLQGLTIVDYYTILSRQLSFFKL